MCTQGKGVTFGTKNVSGDHHYSHMIYVYICKSFSRERGINTAFTKQRKRERGGPKCRPYGICVIYREPGPRGWNNVDLRDWHAEKLVSEDGTRDVAIH